MLHQNARETIHLAEERFLPRADGSGGGRSPTHQFEFDSAWQEMLNHATMKLLEAEHLKHASETEHLRRAKAFAEAQTKVGVAAHHFMCYISVPCRAILVTFSEDRTSTDYKTVHFVFRIS